MDEDTSFGYRVRQRRRTLNLTQDELARRAGCATITIRKIEQDERRPSRQIAERLAEVLDLPAAEREAFVKSARAGWGVARLEAALGATRPADSHPAVRPTGTVTFLFTDLESSTRLWERHGQSMPDALARHDALLREAVTAHHGTIVKQTGDGMHAAFARAGDALAAALAAQRALQQEDWGDVVVRARMALHTGAADERDGDYYGPVVNRVARLLAVAHGGQILLSRATAELVEEQLPSGVTLRELGQHRLEDLTRPEHIVQLVAPDLPADFPPLKTVDNHPTNLPVQRDPLIGREHELAAVAALLARNDVGLVTLTGPGGIGKTRLALQVAAAVLPAYADGAWCVELAPIANPSLVASTIGSTLQLREAQDQPMAEHLAAFLRDKQVLLVLDNFEQVLQAAPLVAKLLTAAPRLKVLVTSRTALRVRGERIIPVPPLAVPDPRQLPSLHSLSEYASVELFLRRAQAVRSEFQLTQDNAAAVAAICVRLEGLPLAIELAAARSGLLAPQALLARLDDPLRLLTSGPRDLPARQQTMRATIDWSYSLLDVTEQQLLSRLAVFVGGWTLEAAEAVCNAAGDLGIEVVDALQSLLDKSLVQQHEQLDGEPRFTMLETIRQYALEKAVMEGKAVDHQRAHATYFLDLAETAEPALHGSQQRAWLERLEAEHDNLRAALEWALAQHESELALRLGAASWHFWYAHSHLSEGRHWLKAVLAGTGSAMPALRADVMYGAGVLAAEQGDLGPADELFLAGHEIRRELNDRSGLADSLVALGNLAHFRGDLDRARSFYEEALAIRQEVDPDKISAWTLNNLGVVALLQGDYRRAVEMHEQSLAIWQKEGDKHGMAAGTSNLARVAVAQNNLDRAHQYFARSLALWWEIGNQAGVAECLEGLALVACLRPDCESSRRRACLFAARLWGAAEAIRFDIASPMLPGDQASFDEGVRAARAHVETEAFEQAWSEGRAMSAGDAVALALEKDGGRSC